MLTANRSVERVTISVPHELASEADSCSAELKVSRSELYKLAMERFLVEQRRERLKLIVAEMAKLPWAGFGPGTEKGAPTKAKPEIWTDQAKFKEAGEKLEAESAKLAAAAKTGNLDALKVAFRATAGSCKACHDAFKAD